jgi:hypothetical protein
MKKYRSYFLILLLLALAGLSVWVYYSRTSARGSGDDEARKFGFKDTAEVTRIFMADKEGNSSLVKRTPTGWVVNDKYNCRSEAILNLLEAIRNVEVKMPVPREAREHVLKFMSANAVKVEVYAGEDLVRQYYVGHETPDGESSYMLLTDVESGENYPDPFVCFIPGFTGYLKPRFITNENEWRDRVVMNFIPPQMRSLSVRYPSLPPDSSFTIELVSTTSFRLLDGRGKELPFSEDKIKQYLVYYQNVSYEALITGKNRKLQDSLLAVKPFCSISIATTDYRKHQFNFYRKQVNPRLIPEIGTTFEYDPDRLYMSFADDREWAIIQYFVFGKLLVPGDYFLPEKSVKK